MKKRTEAVFARAALVAAVAVFAAGAAHGIDVTFSKENGDLALPADWGMESLPDSTNRIAFAASGSAMTATATAHPRHPDNTFRFPITPSSPPSPKA